MSSWVIGVFGRRLRQIVPERRIYIRSDAKTRYRALSPLAQIATAILAALTLGWTAYATYALIVSAIDGHRAEARFETMQEAYEARIDAMKTVQAGLEAELGASQEQGNLVAEQLSKKQSVLIKTANSLRNAEVEAEGLRQEFALAIEQKRQSNERISTLQGEIERLQLTLAETESAGQDLAMSIDTVSDAMNEVITERDSAKTRMSSLNEAVGKLQAKVDYWEGRQERLLSQLESAAQISLTGLDKIFAGARIDVDRIIESTRRDYSGEGGPFEPFEDQSDVAAEADMRIASLMNDLERVNLMRFAAQKIPFGSPVRDGRYTSGFGPRRDPLKRRTSMHTGLDIAAPRGTPIYATGDGVVTFSGRMHGYGIVVKIRHAFGFETLYAHNSRSKVKVGQRVERGDQIAEMGSTGRSTGNHVHYEVRIDRQPVNPMKFIKAARDVL